MTPEGQLRDVRILHDSVVVSLFDKNPITCDFTSIEGASRSKFLSYFKHRAKSDARYVQIIECLIRKGILNTNGDEIRLSEAYRWKHNLNASPGTFL